MTREKLEELYNAKISAKNIVDALAQAPASFEADLALKQANWKWDAAIIAYDAACREYLGSVVPMGRGA
jgi:hypothetical protein